MPIRISSMDKVWLVRGNPSESHVVHGHAGVLICAIRIFIFPLRERAVRPWVADYLVDRFHTMGNSRARILYTWVLGAGI